MQFLVRSFPVVSDAGIAAFVNETRYSVVANKAYSHLVSCSCDDFTRHKIPCKHMYLTLRIYLGMRIPYDGEGDLDGKEEVKQDLDCRIPSLESTLPKQIRLLLQRQRAERKELEQITRDIEKEEAFMECETAMKATADAIVAELHRKKRKCTLEYMQGTSAALRNVYLEVQGLNTVNAGQRCRK